MKTLVKIFLFVCVSTTIYICFMALHNKLISSQKEPIFTNEVTFFKKGETIPDDWYQITPPEAITIRVFATDCVFYDGILYRHHKGNQSASYSYCKSQIEIYGMIYLGTEDDMIENVHIVGPGSKVIFNEGITWEEKIKENHD